MDRSTESLSVLAPAAGASPAVLLTPGRTRNIAQDMEALRLSRQDNPYLQQVMASRESLIESHAEECEADDTILMSQEFGSTALDFVDEDPLTLKEIHEHLIRSPPPLNCWPNESARMSKFEYNSIGASSPLSYSATSINSPEKEVSPRLARCAGRGSRARRCSRSASPHLAARPLSLPGYGERVTLLPPPRRFRQRDDDSERLVQYDK